MKYLLLVYGNDEIWSSFPPEQFREFVSEHDEVNRQLAEEGILVGGYGVADQDRARVVRVVDGASTVTDGPYIETKEYIGSFSIVDCADEDEALRVASRIPSSRYTGVEVRPLLHEAGTER